ncbi:MAG: hypothetical protein CSB33_03285 [Desulfobacterales bacterium]|nr:MAG: hypothetical protein CSB33_03285 [Desulfobacterales bacterium]
MTPILSAIPSRTLSAPGGPAFSRPVILVFFLGLAARLYCLWSRPLFNPDGILYLQQARALYFGEPEQLLACYEYLSNYPLFIAGIFPLTGDWILAGRLVSLCFGTLALIPLYLLLRRLFSEEISCLTLLLFALLPTLVTLSRDIMRDPVYWFFAATGLWLFIRFLETPRHRLLLFSSAAFLMAAWARMEGALFFLCAALWLPVHRDTRTPSHLLSFFGPPAALLILAGIFCMMRDTSLLSTIKPERLLTRPLEFLDRYREIRDLLKPFARHPPPGFSPYFFPKVRNLVWFIALTSLVVQMINSLFYLYPVFPLLGIRDIRRRRKDRRFSFLFFTAAASLPVLYLQIIYNWSMPHRFLMLFFLPAVPVFGLGMRRMRFLLARRLPRTGRKAPRLYRAGMVICLVITLFSSGKILRAHYLEEKLIFHEIGRYIDRVGQPTAPVRVAAAFKQVRFVQFFANLSFPTAPCFDYEGLFPVQAPPDLSRITHIDYIIWDERNSHPDTLSFLRSSPDYRRVRKWTSRRLGRIILFQRDTSRAKPAAAASASEGVPSP